MNYPLYTSYKSHFFWQIFPLTCERAWMNTMEVSRNYIVCVGGRKQDRTELEVAASRLLLCCCGVVQMQIICL